MTTINQKLFDQQAQPDDAICFSSLYMEAIERGSIGTTDLNQHYHPMLNYINECLKQIHEKLERDNTFKSNQNEDVTITSSNQYAGLGHHKVNFFLKTI